VADAAILQTTPDFDRWKQQGDLLRCKPRASHHLLATRTAVPIAAGRRD
jgi:hypothetical protein